MIQNCLFGAVFGLLRSFPVIFIRKIGHFGVVRGHFQVKIGHLRLKLVLSMVKAILSQLKFILWSLKIFIKNEIESFRYHFGFRFF